MRSSESTTIEEKIYGKMPKECTTNLQKQLRLTVEMSSTLAKESSLGLADPLTHNGLLITTPHESRAQFQIGAKNLFIVVAGAKREPVRSS